MTRKIGIIGLGHVGATLLHDLIAGQVFDSYVVIDKDEKKVASDVLDMKDRVANTGYFADFVVNDYSALSDADIVVSSLGNILLQANAANSRFAELPFTSQEVKDVSKKLVASGFSGILIVITNPVDVITQLYQTYTGFPKEKVIGTGTLLDTARMKRAVGEKFGVSPVSVSGYNLGEHGNSQFTAWSQVWVNQTPIQQLLSTDELSQLAVLSNSRVNLPVSHYLESFDTYIGYPALIGRNGIEDSVVLDLPKGERELLDRSAQIIRERVDIAKTGDWDQLIL